MAAAPPELVSVRSLDPRLQVRLRYATADNLTGKVLYRSAEAWLRRETALKLVRAEEQLLQERGVSLLVLDAYRPPSAQRALWVACPDPTFVAPPERGSRHTRGAAVDVTLVTRHGRELPMPSAHDEFGERAARGYAAGPAQTRQHVDWLTEAMVEAGFSVIQSEWWHFDDADWRGMPLLDWEPEG